jgi:hypothetical protein
MEIHFSNIVKRFSDGSMVNVRLERVESIKSALRFNHTEDFVRFINGHYGPENPEDYYLRAIRITYEEVNE